MVIELEKFLVQSRKEVEAINVTPLVEEFVKKTGIKNGMVNIYNQHTSAGLLVTEGLTCLEEDIETFLDQLVPEDGNYLHRRYLDFDGRVGFNAQMHIKSVLVGCSTSFPISDGKIVKGSRQTVYFMEFDGPLQRTMTVQVMGEKI
jgi:secondary thiamine-phosphate synthase enzyme